MGFMLAAGAFMAGAGMLSSYGSQRRAANQMEAGAEQNWRLRQQQAESILERFKYNRIRERLNAQRFSGKQIAAFAKGGVSGRTPLSVVEDTIGVVEETLFNKQMDAEIESYMVSKQADFDLKSARQKADASREQAKAGLLKNFGSTIGGMA